MTDSLRSFAPRLLGIGQHQAPIRLRTLVRLRWLAVIGQTGTVLLVSFMLQYQLPLGACLAVIALSAWLNVFLAFRWRAGQILSTRAAGLLLAYDVVQLAGLLYLTGGLQNPFAFLFLVPVTVSATALTLRWTMSLGIMAFAFSVAMAGWGGIFTARNLCWWHVDCHCLRNRIFRRLCAAYGGGSADDVGCS
jgi:two-component system, sensor histidine kinase RegB